MLVVRCKGTTADGGRCKREIADDEEYCYQHRPTNAKKGGRPVKYDNKYIENLADEVLEWFNADEDNVFLDDFMVEKGLPGQYVSRFAKKNDYFCESLKICKTIQKQRLLHKGLDGEWDKTLTLFTLKNVSEMRDKQEHKVEQDGNITINVEGV